MALSKMTSTELRDRLESIHNEVVARKCSKVEMLKRSVELEGESALEEPRKIVTPLQGYITMMNQASRKKQLLQDLARGTFRLAVTGNETIPMLKVKCTMEAYKLAEPCASDMMGFGKYADRSYVEAAQDVNYVEWAKRTMGEESVDPRLKRWVKWVTTVKDEDMVLRLPINEISKKHETKKQSERASSPKPAATMEKLTEAVEALTREVAAVREERAKSSDEPVRKTRPMGTPRE